MTFSTYYRVYTVKKLLLLTTIIVGTLFFFFLIKKNTDAEKQIIFVVDVSQSMNVQDIMHKNYHISRLDAVKLSISGLITETKKPFARGIIIYSSVAKYLVPPTQDKQTLLHYLASINTNSLPGGGSNPEVVFGLLAKQNKKISQTVIWHTDGEWEENNNKNIISKEKKHNQKQEKDFFSFDSARVIGRGTKKGGIVKNTEGNIVFYNGNAVFSKRNDEGLKQIASKCGAKVIKKESTKKLPISLDKEKKIPTSTTKWRLFGIGILSILGSL